MVRLSPANAKAAPQAASNNPAETQRFFEYTSAPMATDLRRQMESQFFKARDEYTAAIRGHSEEGARDAVVLEVESHEGGKVLDAGASAQEPCETPGQVVTSRSGSQSGQIVSGFAVTQAEPAF